MINDSPRRRLPRWASGAIVALVAVALLTPGPWRQVEPVSSGVLTPVQMGISGTVDQLTTIVDTVQQVRGLAEQNSEYRDQIAQLQSEVVNMHELEVENSQLRDLLGMAQRTGPGELLPVSVIARDDTPYVQAVTIDRGTTRRRPRGQHRDHPQRAWSVASRVPIPTSAKVRLITDINQSVAVRLQSESRSTGVLRGQSQGNLLVVTYIPQADTIRVGDPVLTSGLGEVFPENLVVGKVARVEHTDADPYQTAVVEPAVDMDKLEQMYVIAERSERAARQTFTLPCASSSPSACCSWRRSSNPKSAPDCRCSAGGPTCRSCSCSPGRCSGARMRGRSSASWPGCCSTRSATRRSG